MAKLRPTCSVEGCNRPNRRNGLCGTHSARMRRTGSLETTLDPYGTFHPCAVAGCGKARHSFGYCRAHYTRLQKHGDPLGGRRPIGYVLNWVREHAEYRGDDCLKWPFKTNPAGYGSLSIAGHSIVASRYMCILINGEPPTPDHEAAHSCGKGHTGCVNPMHLRWATRAENQHDMVLHGTAVIGERNPMAKISDADVERLRELWPTMPRAKVAALFGLDVQYASQVARGRVRIKVAKI